MDSFRSFEASRWAFLFNFSIDSIIDSRKYTISLVKTPTKTTAFAAAVSLFMTNVFCYPTYA